VAAVDIAGNIGPSAQITLTVDNPPGYVLRSDMMLLLGEGIVDNAFYDEDDTLKVYMPVNTTETHDDHFLVEVLG
jgi:hypothetical protein